MIEPNADRDAIYDLVTRDRSWREDQCWAMVDTDDLLIVDLRCPTCEGQGAVSGFPETPWEQCPTCHSTGRRTVKVVEDSWDGLMSMLDDIYPADTFTGASGNPAPTVVVLLRQIDLLRRGEQPRSKVVDADQFERLTAVVRAAWKAKMDVSYLYYLGLTVAALTPDDIEAVSE